MSAQRRAATGAARRHWQLPLALLAALLLARHAQAAADPSDDILEEKVVSSEDMDPAVRRMRDTEADMRGKLERDPTDFRAILGLATALSELDALAPDGGRRVPEAVELYRAALAKSRDGQVQAFVLSQLAALLLRARKVKEAADILHQNMHLAEKAGVRESEMYAGMLLDMAKAQDQLGNVTGAQRLYSLALKKAKDASAAIYAQAWLGMKTFSEGEMKELEELADYLRRRREGVDEETMSEGELDAWQDLADKWNWMDSLGSRVTESCVPYALASAYRQLGKEEEAWEALDEANSLRDVVAGYDPKMESKNLDDLISAFPVPKPDAMQVTRVDGAWAALLRGTWGARDRNLNPVFVVGLPRSGASLVDQLLASHPKVWSIGGDSSLAPRLPDLFSIISAQGEVPTANITSAGKKTLAEMRWRVPKDELPRVRWVVDTMLRNLWNVGFILMALPDACIVHVTRHPADLGLSAWEHAFPGKDSGWAYRLSNIAHQITESERLAAHWDAVFPGRMLRVRYEDLVKDQEGTALGILSHCGIPWHNNLNTPLTHGGAELKLHSNSILRYRKDAPRLLPLLKRIEEQVLMYEADAGLESSFETLHQLLRSSEGGEGEGGGGGGEERSDAETRAEL